MPIKRIVTGQKITAIKAGRARELRHHLTFTEGILWSRLRRNRLEGFHFRRQQVIEPYIVDFYCHEADLVVEIDGDIHCQQEEYDRQRDQYLESLGLHVIRFSNKDIMQNLNIVLEQIYRACIENSKRPGNDLNK